MSKRMKIGIMEQTEWKGKRLETEISASDLLSLLVFLF